MSSLKCKCRLKNWLFYGFLISLLLTLNACHKKDTEKKTENYTVITVESKPLTTSLHFSGTLAPLSSELILTPLAGRITKIYFNYGQKIEKGQRLVSLNATKLTEDYRKAVSDFLEKKQAFEAGNISFQGTEALHKAGVISNEEYLTASNRHKSDTLSYYQTRHDLQKLLPQANISFETIEKLNLADIKKVNPILNRTFDEINLTSSANGIALFPTSQEKKESTGSGAISVGDEVKSGQLIVSIGDLTGFSMKINVSEISINLIKPGTPAIITGDAFPGISLQGQVATVARQANPQENENSLAMFEVQIKIPQITLQQQQIIHVGMSAKVRLDIAEKPQILVPIKAVFTVDGKRMVTAIESKSGEKHNVVVITGKTTLTDVAIVEGLAPGDRIVVPN